ncbi:MAG: AMP-binding protein [Cellvibrionaceae bacterium]|nr:AMP-binding protein [Cellvibrionaceae bacterium]
MTMFYINDFFYDDSYIKACFSRFDKHALISQCAGKRFTLCLQDAALWLALCLYIKQQGGSVFPLTVDTPMTAARRRAQASRSHYLVFGKNDTLEKNTIETITQRADDQHGVLLQMSSGTGGTAKIITRRWCSIDREINAYIQHFPEAHQMTPVIAAPVTHAYGLISGVLVALKRGATPRVITHLHPKYLLRKLQALEHAILYSSPTLIDSITLLMKGDQMLHAVMSSGTSMQEALFARVKSKTHHLYQQYGCSEVGCISLGKLINSYNDIGAPLPHQRVHAGTDRLQPDEIRVSDGKTSVFTQDLAYFDARGNLRFIARIDDTINVAGLNVYPSEIENIILSLPTISDAVVFKHRYDAGCDQICLHFVANQRIQPKTIRTWCRKQLAAHQIPMHIKQVKRIDKLPNGKINRHQLAASI